VSTPSSPRRLGAAESKSRDQLIDAAEQLLVSEGYAAVTSRRVGAKAGLKPQLVHYYFRSMDDLFVEIFRRRAEKGIAAFERAVSADPSLHTLWRVNTDPAGASFSIEFVALAKHRPAIRGEIARYAERFRAAQLEAMRTALAAGGVTEDQIPPLVALLLMTGIGQVIGIEAALGVTSGHRDTVAYVEDAIAHIESTAARAPYGSRTAQVQTRKRRGPKRGSTRSY
jgi:AcrR family transcriptional regulator